MDKSECIKELLADECKHAFFSAYQGLSHYPLHLLELAVKHNVKIRILNFTETYAKVSDFFKNFSGNKSLQNARGLFIVPENTFYIKDACPATIVHEFAHALDLCLGKEANYEGYFSTYDASIHCAFAKDKAINVYAASRVDEFFAESIRAYLDVNEEVWHSTFNVSKENLQENSPIVFRILEHWFSEKSLASSLTQREQKGVEWFRPLRYNKYISNTNKEKRHAEFYNYLGFNGI